MACADTVRGGRYAMWLPTSSATTSSTRGLLAHVARGGFRPDQVNAAALARYDTRTPEQLLALLTDHLQPCGLPAALGGRVALV
jgi:hypothetical protein